MRISTTELDNFRYLCDQQHFTVDEIVQNLRQREETEKMRAGQAFHWLLQHAADDLSQHTVWANYTEGQREFSSEPNGGDHYRFTFQIDQEIVLPPLREVKTERRYQIDGMAVTVVAMADCLSGPLVCDHKLTDKFAAERYTDALQWRTYLALFGAEKFLYNLFVGKEKKPRQWEIRELHQLTFFRYGAVERDVQDAVEDYARFLARFLPERITAGDDKNLVF